MQFFLSATPGVRDSRLMAFLLFRVLLFRVMLLKLHLFHSSLSLSLSLSIHFSLFISHSFVLFSSLFLFFSLLHFSWRVKTRRERRRNKSARAKLSLSLSPCLLSKIKNYKAFFTAATVSASKALISSNIAATLAALASCMTAETILSPLEST